MEYTEQELADWQEWAESLPENQQEQQEESSNE